MVPGIGCLFYCSFFNPFTARVLDRVLKGDCNFCVCGRNSYDVTIQMKAPCLYFHMVLFVFQNVRKCNLEIFEILPLTTFGSERFKTAEARLGFDRL